MTSTALTLAAVWPQPVVLLEADPAGGDLAYRCRAAHGGTISTEMGLLQLAATVRGGLPGIDVVNDESQLLACGVNLVQGVTSAAQARGFGGIWRTIAQACISAEVDVIADLGRLDRTSPVMPLAQAASHLLPVASTSLESVMHLTEGLQDLLGELAQSGPTSITPVLVGPDSNASRDVADLDSILQRSGLPTLPTQSMPVDAKALMRLEHGEKASGRLGRTLLMRGAKAIGTSVRAQAVCV